MNPVFKRSKVKCPYCSFEKVEEMPMDACIIKFLVGYLHGNFKL